MGRLTYMIQEKEMTAEKPIRNWFDIEILEQKKWTILEEKHLHPKAQCNTNCYLKNMKGENAKL